MAAGKEFITKFVKYKWGIGYRKATKALNSSGINGETVGASSATNFN